MSRRFRLILPWLVATLLGCSNTKQPPNESIPNIPPVRSAILKSGERDAPGKTPPGLTPQPPK